VERTLASKRKSSGNTVIAWQEESKSTIFSFLIPPSKKMPDITSMKFGAPKVCDWIQKKTDMNDVSELVRIMRD
jgi:hypothetical protein